VEIWEEVTWPGFYFTSQPFACESGYHLSKRFFPHFKMSEFNIIFIGVNSPPFFSPPLSVQRCTLKCNFWWVAKLPKTESQIILTKMKPLHLRMDKCMHRRTNICTCSTVHFILVLSNTFWWLFLAISSWNLHDMHQRFFYEIRNEISAGSDKRQRISPHTAIVKIAHFGNVMSVDMTLPKWEIFTIGGLWGNFSFFIWSNWNFVSDVHKKCCWHTSCKFQLEIRSNKKVITKNRLTNWYEMHVSPCAPSIAI